jgi:hypothetical protein
MYGWDPRVVIDALGVLGGIVGESGVALVVRPYALNIEGCAGVGGSLPASVRGDMSLEPELVEDPHDIR